MSAIRSVLMALKGVLGNNTEEELKNTVEYNEHGFSIIDCPICHSKTMDMFWICSECGWEYDLFIDYNNDDEFSDCNGERLGEYKNVYRIFRDAFEKMKNSGSNQFYIITCWSKGTPYYDPGYDPFCYTYGAFESVDDCQKALIENRFNMHSSIYYCAEVESVDMEYNVHEIGWFIWDEEKQGFFETAKEANWSFGGVYFD